MINQLKNVRVGFLHPGQMGISIAKAITDNVHQRLWASGGRSTATAQRAQDAALIDCETVHVLCQTADVIFSICPPDKALDIATDVAAAGFSGIYVDANAVSPASANQVADIVSQAGGAYVDGGIIGPPATRPGSTRFYLSGGRAEEILPLFENTIVEGRVVTGPAGAASALKMAFAGWSKGATALLATQYALARAQGVEQALLEEWQITFPHLADKLEADIGRAAPKAWRFVGEMDEIAKTLDAAGLPGEWFTGAGKSYARLRQFKDSRDPDFDVVIDAMINLTIA